MATGSWEPFATPAKSPVSPSVIPTRSASKCSMLETQRRSATWSNAPLLSSNDIDAIVSNAGYGLFGAAKELSDKQSMT